MPLAGDKWDFEWIYTDGNPLQHGFTAVARGAYSLFQVSDGYKLTADLGGYIFLTLPDFLSNSLILEADCVLNPALEEISAQNTRISISNGTKGISLYQNMGEWRIMDANYLDEGTVIKSFTETNQLVTVRLSMKNGTATAEIDGVQYVSGFNINTSYYATRTMFGQQNGGDSVLRALRIKKGELQ